MKTIDSFCGQNEGYSRSITLRNKLIPIGETEKNIKEFLEKDVERSEAYPQIKKLIDDIHRGFIEECLSNVSFPWEPLFDQFELYQNEKEKIKKNAKKKELIVLQVAARKRIVKAFKDNKDFEKLFKEELFKELLPQLIKSAPVTEIADKEKALSVFTRFSTYFNGFHENRKNMYSEEEISTGIAYRIVNENFPKFFSNIKLFEYLKDNFPEIIKETEISLKDTLKGKKLCDIFKVEAFNNVLSQSGIDFYNTIISGVAGEGGTQKIKGMNEIINLAKQQLPKEEKDKLHGKMVVLFKQILSDRETASFIPTGFEKNEEVYASIKEFNNIIVKDSVTETRNLFALNSDIKLNEIIVPAKSITAFSLTIFGNWVIISEGLYLLEKDKITKALSEKQEEQLHKDIDKKDCNLEEIQSAYERWCSENGEIVRTSVRKYFNLIETQSSSSENTSTKKEVCILDEITKSFSQIDFENEKDLQQEKEAATPIKIYLDEVQNLYHHLKLVDYRGEEQKDSNFYSKFDEIIEKLSEIISIYNKVRNFVTKKPGEVKKVKLNFDCPTLANGWDENKEKDNDAILLLKDGNYYLGIYNPKNKPKFDFEESKASDCYKKVVYKLLPGPNKMLPKVFFSAKGQKEFLPPKELLLGYEEGKHKKGENFDKEFMYKLIDWFKDAINRHEDWKKFDFKFSDTRSYEDMSAFYKEVELQGYKISFKKVSTEIINEFVNSSKLFLFQIYNKDFAVKATGKKNLHTLYWENLFSEENLKDICFKLNGEAELFWRKASLIKEKVTVHKKNSILINRTKKDGSTIPENLYQEIYQYKNNMISDISENAKDLLNSGKVICKKATHDITKDKHFTEDAYLFHCPITMNFKAPEITGRKFNDKVLEALKENPEIKIIGLDRGERHLIYLSLINQKGEIELQKTLNLVDQIRNDKTVQINYQEKLVQNEGDRDKARKNWQTIGNIKELKEGYLSAIIHEIATLMIENNAIVVMEDLNFGFKHGRFAVERQVYQKFENMLIEKLNYLVFKDRSIKEPGGVLNAYQLTDKAANVSDVYKQCGWLFYIPAGYTSKIDPKTGFANLFVTKGLTNVEKKKDFFSKFDSIYYDEKEACFVFAFDYSKFGDNADFKKKWEVYTKGERLVYSKQERKSITVSPTEELKKIFNEFSINWNNSESVLDQIKTIPAEKLNAKFFDTLLRAFNATLQMRNSVPNSSRQEDDYLISPVKARDGTFYDSRIEAEKGIDKNGRWVSKLPVDADANGAYHIALKGLYLLENNFNRNEKGVIQNISNVEWFKFAQTK
ncbi:MAG: type V CRISPR-associated protein Cas12a/Cpf1 [Treponema sp.]|nr:type V CRISPR-associated protein Cas12a/Cpf1 [Treponema sp.]